MKRIISLIIVVGFVLGLASCDESYGDYFTEKTLAVRYASSDEYAANEYISNLDDYTKVTYNSASDVVVAVENGKSDYGILNEYDYNTYILLDRDIQMKEVCTYSEDYCAYFDSQSKELQEAFNRAIAEINDDGTLEKIKTAHFSGKEFSPVHTDRENGTLTMLCDPNFKNRVYTDDDGCVVGLDVDIAREICGAMGYGLEIVIGDFDQLFSMLEKGEGDFIITACQVTEERTEYYLASDIYFTLNFFVIERKR
ncbi:MAG: transporter substrate-binding domain-containing protein [Acutalibacteraceae bacterium]